MSDTHEKHPELPIEEAGQSGFSGFYERLLRRYPEFTHGLTLVPIYGFASLLLGSAVSVGVLLFDGVSEASGHSTIGRGIGIGAGFFASGFTLLLLVSLISRFLRPWVRPGRGQSHSNRFIPWYLFNALAYLVRYTFLEFITPTPFNLWYFRAMGMKVGRKVVINSSNITDAPLITLEDGVTIGGSAVILAHYGMSGYLILAPVVIRRNAVIGLHAKIMAGVEIGEGAKIMPGSVVMPKTVVPPGEIWGGVPAVRVAP
jgi:acetyltransferase-like isoleucine patch superfamily enzyme